MDGFYARDVDDPLNINTQRGVPIVTVRHLSVAEAFGNEFLNLFSELASKRVSFVNNG